MKSRLLGAVCAAVFSVITLPSHAVLIPVLGGQAYYDTDTDLTWLANASAGGYKTWADAMTWAASLTVGGYTDWRLPNTNPIDGTTADDAIIAYNGTEDRGYNVSAPGTLFAGSQASELAYLFYNTLGNKAFCDPVTSTASVCGGNPQPGWGLTNTGPFSNVQTPGYWSSTEYAPNTDRAWIFAFYNGIQGINEKVGGISGDGYAWAVRSGNVSAVPIPAAVWLFGSGLVGLIGIARRKRA